MVEAIPDTRTEVVGNEAQENIGQNSTEVVVKTDKQNKVKRRKKIVWSVNVFTVILYMIDPKHMLCTGKFKQVSKRFRKACEIV
jgi:hypothetical protein